MNYLRSGLFTSVDLLSVPRRVEREIIRSWMDETPTSIACDVACGNGRFSRMMSERSLRVYAVDLRFDALRFGVKRNQDHRNTKVVYVQGDVCELPFPKDGFDLLVCNSSLEHFQDDRTALQEMARVIEPGGYLIITVDALNQKHITLTLREKHKHIAQVVNYYDSESLIKKIRDAGFVPTRVVYYLTSTISHFVSRWGLAKKWSGPIYKLMAPFLAPICTVADRLSKEQDCGWGLAVLANKSMKTHINDGLEEKNRN